MSTYAMSGRACRARVIGGTRSAIKFALERTPPADLKAALCELRRRIGESGPVEDDVLGWAPDRWEPVTLETRTGEYDRRANADLRNSIEFMESQPWLPASARTITESVLQAIGRPSVDALVASLPEPEDLAWESICGWVRRKRRDDPGRLRMARRARELLTGSWPWSSRWVETQRSAAWVNDLLGREKRVVLDYAPITKCTCPACVSRREEIENARNKFYLGELRHEVSDVRSALRVLTSRVACIEGTLSGR